MTGVQTCALPICDNPDETYCNDGEWVEDEFRTHNTQWDREFQVGDTFTNIKDVRQRVKEYAIKVGFKCNRQKNGDSRFTATCNGLGCNWRLHISKINDGVLMVKTYHGQHTCIRESNNREADMNWLAKNVVEKLKEMPNMTADELILWATKKLGVTVPYMRMYRARLKAIDLLGGDPDEAYRLMPRYVQMINRTNPQSIVELECDYIERPPLFKRLFMGLEGLRRGFLSGCAPFLFFDGCHLKGRYGGVLLSAVGTDANCGLYPIAVAVVESECKESWGFFLHCLKNMLGPFEESKHWHFMADRQKVQIGRAHV